MNAYVRITVIILLVVLSGCIAQPSPTASADIEIKDRIDFDCDGRASHLTAKITNVYLNDVRRDTVGVIDYQRGVDGDIETLKKFGDISEIPQTIEISHTDLNVDSQTKTRLMIEIRTDEFLNNERLFGGFSSTDRFFVESEKKDRPKINVGSERPRPGELVRFSLKGETVENCRRSIHWDIDNDGRFEQSGEEIEVSYPMDGRHDVTLRVTDSGETVEIIEDVLVFHDPDDDGVTTARERRLGTDPNDWDTDNDLFSDKIDPAPQTLLVPTGVLHIVLIGALYFGAFWYWVRIRRWFAAQISRVSRLSRRVRSEIQHPVAGARSLRRWFQSRMQNPFGNSQVLVRQLQSRFWSALNQIKRWIDRYI